MEKQYDGLVPVYNPAIGVCIPLAALTALLVNAPQVGIDEKKLPSILQMPSVNISCFAFNELPLAKIDQIRYFFFKDNNK